MSGVFIEFVEFFRGYVWVGFEIWFGINFVNVWWSVEEYREEINLCVELDFVDFFGLGW